MFTPSDLYKRVKTISSGTSMASLREYAEENGSLSSRYELWHRDDGSEVTRTPNHRLNLGLRSQRVGANVVCFADRRFQGQTVFQSSLNLGRMSSFLVEKPNDNSLLRAHGK
jgi:hypothetical protein